MEEPSPLVSPLKEISMTTQPSTTRSLLPRFAPGRTLPTYSL